MRKGKQILAIVLSGFLAMGVCQGPVFAVQSGEKSVQAMENEETVFPSEFEETDYIQPEDEEMIVTDETAAVGELYDSEEAPPYEGVPQGFDSSQQEDLPQGSDSSQQEGGFSDADNPPQEEIVEESIETDNPEEKESSDAGEMAEEEKEITESTDEFFEDAPYATNEDSQEDAGVEEYTSDTGSQQEGLTHDADNPPQEETVEESIETDNPEEKENSDGSEMAGEEKEVTESTDDFFEDAPYVNNEDSQADAHSEEYISDTVGDPEDTSRIDGNEITYDDVPEEFTGTDELKASENDSIDLINAVEEAEKTKESMEESLFEEGQEIETTEEQAMFGNIHYDVATEYDGLAYSIRSNCVAFVRYKVPSLPSVGDTLETKKAIINSYTPVAGCVAIETNGYSTGHVSYVEAVNGNTVTTLHGGFQGAINGVDYTNRIIRKTGTPSDLGIVGYWIPGGSSPSQNPTNPTLTVNKTRFTSSDTIYLKAHADGAIRYYGAIYKGSTRIWEGDCLEGGVIQYSASLFGAGQFSAYVSCTNYVGGVDTNWVGYTVAEDIGDNFYAFITTNWEKEWKFLGASPNGNVQLVNSGDRYHPRQIWKFKQQSDGSYKILNMYWESYFLNTGKQFVLSCESDGKVNNTNVIVSSENGGSSQKWFIDYDANYGFRFTPSHCLLAMDLTAGSTGIGTNIQLYQYNDSSAQRFDIYKLSKDNVTYNRPGKPSASNYTGVTGADVGKVVNLTWTDSPKVNDFDKRSYRLQIFDNTGKEILNKSGLTDTYYNYTFNSQGTYSVKITAVNDYYKDYETSGSSKQIKVTVPKAAQSITVKAAASSVAVGKTTTVSITGAKGTKSYKSSDTTIATVTSAGKVSAKKVGTVKITATSAATSNYNAASKTVTIKVVPAAATTLTLENMTTGIKLTWNKVTGATGYRVYREDTSGKTLLKKISGGSTLTYKDTTANTNGKKYRFYIYATAGTGMSTLSKSRATYRLTKPAVSSVTNSAASKMTVKWGKNSTATGYSIQYSLSSSFDGGNKTVTAAGASTVSKVIASLTRGKTYYVRIRTYKTVDGVKFWSAWSAAKSVKISK